ncbi:Large ribosomal subunit protein uL2 [Entamoeba marina]
MGRRTVSQRKGRGSIFKSRSQHKIGVPLHRSIDYYERHAAVRGMVKEIKHDPGRGAPLAKVVFKNPRQYGLDKELFICAEGLYSGQYIYCGNKASLHVGNILPIGQLPEGTVVCNVENKPGDRGMLARASGNYATIVSHNAETHCTRIRLPSGIKKTLKSTCRAMNRKPVLKAGRAYWHYKAKRTAWPRVRGVAMNPVDHPHGGGNHQHVGHPTTVKRSSPPGQKAGKVAARRTGLIRGGKKNRGEE